MAGLAHDAAHFFKFLFIIVLYTLAMTLWVRLGLKSFSKRTNLSSQNFYLGVLFSNGGIAILLSALSALYQMTYAGFFVHLGDIPPVLRWLQWLCPLKYALEALSVNEVGSGLMIQDTLEGVPVNVSASLIMDVVRISLLSRIVSTADARAAALWLQLRQLLPRRAGGVCVHRGPGARGDLRGVVQGEGASLGHGPRTLHDR